VIAQNYGWEMSFILIGALGFVWMGFWQFMYNKPEENPKVNQAELDYIRQDIDHQQVEEPTKTKEKVSILACLKYNQTWALIAGKFLTDGVWWFLLFWFPAYLSSVYDLKSSDFEGQIAIFVLYAITMLSIIG